MSNFADMKLTKLIVFLAIGLLLASCQEERDKIVKYFKGEDDKVEEKMPKRSLMLPIANATLEGDSTNVVQLVGDSIKITGKPAEYDSNLLTFELTMKIVHRLDSLKGYKDSFDALDIVFYDAEGRQLKTFSPLEQELDSVLIQLSAQKPKPVTLHYRANIYEPQEYNTFFKKADKFTVKGLSFTFYKKQAEVPDSIPLTPQVGIPVTQVVTTDSTLATPAAHAPAISGVNSFTSSDATSDVPLPGGELEAMIGEYEGYINQLEEMHNQQQAGDLSMMTRIADVMSKANALYNKINLSKQSMSGSQLTRFTSAATKAARLFR